MIGDAGLTSHMHKHGYSYLGPEEAARQVVEGLKRGKRLIIPGGFNRLIYLLGSILPRRLVVRLAGNIYNYSKYGSSH
jgi:short-subunit dehydrogenase